MPRLERDFQADLIKELKSIFIGCVVFKNDPNYQQGFPDLTILFGNRWAILECKKSLNEKYEPNQEWFIEQLNLMSYSAMICPENRELILDELRLHFTSRAVR